MKDQKRDRKDKTDKTHGPHGGKTLLAILAIPEKFPINRAPTCPTIPRPCLVWSGAWSMRHRSAWTQYYQRYGRRAEVTELVPSVCCNLYTPKVTAGARARSGWIKGRMPIWLFGPLETRLQEAQMVTREADGLLPGVHGHKILQGIRR